MPDVNKAVNGRRHEEWRVMQERAVEKGACPSGLSRVGGLSTKSSVIEAGQSGCSALSCWKCASAREFLMGGPLRVSAQEIPQSQHTLAMRLASYVPSLNESRHAYKRNTITSTQHEERVWGPVRLSASRCVAWCMVQMLSTAVEGSLQMNKEVPLWVVISSCAV